MKPTKIISQAIVLVLLLAAIIALTCFNARAAGTVTYDTHKFLDGKVMLMTFSVTADASNGSIPSTTFGDPAGYFICSIETDPGTTAPTDDYDIVLNTAGGADVLGGAGANRDTSTTEIAYPTINSTSGQKGCVPVNSALTMAISNNSVHSAGITIKLFFSKRP